MPKSVLVVGQGYVGLPLAMRALAVGHRVVGFRHRPGTCEAPRQGRVLHRRRKLLRTDGSTGIGSIPSTDSAADCAGFEIAVITVPTPLKESVPDLSFIEAAAWIVGRHVEPGTCVVLESTTYPGTTTELLAPILEEASGLVAGADFHLGYSPERIDPGNGTWGLANTPKVVSGIDEASLAAVESFYDTMVERTVPVSGTGEAELVKLLENTFRHVNIALVNELAMFAGDLGVDIWEAIAAADTKPFGFMRFNPGPGVGGHCLPIRPELSFMARKAPCGHRIPFRRACERRQRQHARICGATPHAVAQPAW